jgi:hypothetical protein
LDALFGASDDAVEIGPEAVRRVPATHCRLTVDLGRADVALPAGVSVPSGPYRALSRMPPILGRETGCRERRRTPAPDTMITASDLSAMPSLAGTAPGPGQVHDAHSYVWRIIGNSPELAFADLNRTVTNVTTLARRA